MTRQFYVAAVPCRGIDAWLLASLQKSEPMRTAEELSKSKKTRAAATVGDRRAFQTLPRDQTCG
jgi:hypothetical protein